MRRTNLRRVEALEKREKEEFDRIQKKLYDALMGLSAILIGPSRMREEDALSAAREGALRMLGQSRPRQRR
jgi:hypothetical protein